MSKLKFMSGRGNARTVAAAALAGGLLVGAGAVGYAAIPSANGVISGCIGPNGQLRVIDTEAGVKCASSERPLSWNHAGQRGPAGPEGPQGAAGQDGADGADGSSLASFRQQVGEGRHLLFTLPNGVEIFGNCTPVPAPGGSGSVSWELNRNAGLEVAGTETYFEAGADADPIQRTKLVYQFDTSTYNTRETDQRFLTVFDGVVSGATQSKSTNLHITGATSNASNLVPFGQCLFSGTYEAPTTP